MRIVQVLPTISYGDAIGNEVLAIYHLLLDKGYFAEIYAENIDPRVSKYAMSIAQWKEMDREDVLIYHMSINSHLNTIIKKSNCRKAVWYHNSTPGEYFELYDEDFAEELGKCPVEFKSMNNTFDYAIADSSFNKDELIRMGYQCPIQVIPIMLNFKDYSKKNDSKILERIIKFRGKKILHVGRIAPNKKIEDLIKTFYVYQSRYDAEAVLVLAGKYDERDSYYKRLLNYVKKLALKNVVFTGHIKFEELLSLYKTADIYLCMSEHEGFCVPLVESMYFNLPVVAYSAAAVPETLGNAGVLISDKNPNIAAAVVNRVLQDHSLNTYLKECEKKRITAFQSENTNKLFLNSLRELLQIEKNEKK